MWRFSDHTWIDSSSMVTLTPYQSAWADEFRTEAARLLSALAGRIDLVEHIGSTAIPGLAAKPIIDLAARVTAGTDPFDLAEQVETMGYLAHTSGPKNHGIYVRHVDGRRTHILHVFARKTWDTCNQRLFRDKLLRDPSARARYASIKLSASALDDGRAYTAAKLPLIEELLNDERAARGLSPTAAWDK